jgi:hypothetical protein
MIEVKNALQKFWLDLCTKQVVSGRACANQFLPYSSSGIALFGMRTVQADSCLNSEQIDTLFISVGGQKGWEGGGYFGPEAQNLHMAVMILFFTPPGKSVKISNSCLMPRAY